MIKNINIYELKNLIKEKDVLIIDTREASEYKKKRIPNAINIEVENTDIILKICPDKNRKIVLYCTRGVRSIVVAEQLDKFGYKKIYNLEKGLENL